MTEERKSFLINQTLNSGIEPITLRFSPILYCSGKELMALRTEQVINSVVVGVMGGGQYRYIADTSDQGERLAMRNLDKVIDTAERMIETGTEFEWISLYVPPKMVCKTDICATLDNKLSERGFTHPEKICLEMPREILFEDVDVLRETLLDLKLVGVKSMLWGFGDEFTPAMRLSQLQFDYVVTDTDVTEKMSSRNTERITRAAVAYVRSVLSEVIVQAQAEDPVIEKFRSADCKGFIDTQTPSATLEEALEHVR